MVISTSRGKLDALLGDLSGSDSDTEDGSQEDKAKTEEDEGEQEGDEQPKKKGKTITLEDLQVGSCCGSMRR